MSHKHSYTKTGKAMPMLASTRGAQSSIERKMEAFSIPALRPKGICEILLHMESKMFGFVRFWFDLINILVLLPRLVLQRQTEVLKTSETG